MTEDLNCSEFQCDRFSSVFGQCFVLMDRQGHRRVEHVCIRIRHRAPRLQLSQRGDRSAPIVHYIAHWTYAHASDDRFVSEMLLIQVAQPTVFSFRSKNIQTVMVARFLQGGFGSTGAVMVAGTCADIWLPVEYALSFPTAVIY